MESDTDYEISYNTLLSYKTVSTRTVSNVLNVNPHFMCFVKTYVVQRLDRLVPSKEIWSFRLSSTVTGFVLEHLYSSLGYVNTRVHVCVCVSVSNSVNILL